MSSAANTASTQHTFLVFAPDYTDEDAPERRLKARSQHLSGAKRLQESGFIKTGGVFLTPESIESPDSPRKMIGSMLVVQGTTLAEVKKKLEDDIYWTAGVWDKEKIQIVPFVQAI